MSEIVDMNHNKMLIARIKGVKASPASEESKVDPRNPNDTTGAASFGAWWPIETAPTRTIVLVCNPVEGFVPVVAKKVGEQWFNIGAVPVGRSSPKDYHLDPLPLFWMPIPDPPATHD